MFLPVAMRPSVLDIAGQSVEPGDRLIIEELGTDGHDCLSSDRLNQGFEQLAWSQGHAPKPDRPVAARSDWPPRYLD